MKRLSCWVGMICYLAVFITAPGSAFAGDSDWKWMNPLPQGDTLRGVWGSSATDVFAVGLYGAIVHYDGTSWAAMSSGTTQHLHGVWGSSPTDVFAVGANGVILHYDGTSWAAMSSGTTQHLNGVWGSSATDVFAVGVGGPILHYDGTSWSNMPNSSTAELYGVWGNSATDVFAVGRSGNIVHYNGTSWSAMTSGTTHGLWGVWGSSATDVFAVGAGGTILHYDGTSWSAMDSGTEQILRSIWGSSATDVFIVGDSGTILHYNGTDWSPMTSGTTHTLWGVWGNSATDVIAVGGSGTIVHYDGKDWSTMISSTTQRLWGVWGSSATDVFAVGEGGTILHYDGSDWLLMNSGTTQSLHGVWGSSATDVFAVGAGGAILHYNGTSWSPMTSGTTQWLYGVWGSSATDVFAVGNNGTILNYDGSDWSTMTSGTTQHLWDIWGSSETSVYSVGSSGTILHHDGTVWSAQPSGTTQTLVSVWGSSDTSVFAVGGSGTILHYNGTNWSAQPSGTNRPLRSVWGSSATNVFAVGLFGTILHYDYTDWSAMNSGTSQWLECVWGSSALDVFSVGVNGTILHHSPDPTAPTVATNPATGIMSNSATLNMNYTIGSYGTVDVRFAHKKSSDAAWTHTDWATKSVPGDNAETISGLDSDTPYEFKAQLGYNAIVLDGETQQFTTSSVAQPPTIGLSRKNLYFGHEIGGTPPAAQQVMITNTGGGVLDWTAAANTWIGVAPAAGIGDAMIAVSVDATGLAAGTYTSQVTVAAEGATNSPQMIDITLNIYAAGALAPPFGHFDTPVDGAVVHGAVPVTGWALDDVEVTRVEIKRSPHPADDPAAIGPDGLVYIGDGTFVEGARPDVEAAYPDYPLNYRAGWGYMLLTNTLPGGGNGPFTLHAFAVDTDANRTKLGEKTIAADNANSELPFGTIDTPEPGGVISGAAFQNFGWALTPQPNMIPIDGSTITIWVDGVMLGNVTYNIFRPDVAALFPGYANSNGSCGLYVLDTTALANGMHTIAWRVEDDAGNVDGVGSRYFTVFNVTAVGAPAGALRALSEIGPIPTAFHEPVYVVRGFDAAPAPEMIHAGVGGAVEIAMAEVEQVELVLGVEAMERAVRSGRWSGRIPGLTRETPPPAEIGRLSYTGYLLVGDELRPLPIGSTLDPRAGTFAWQPGPGFLGEYTFVFVRESRGDVQDKTLVRITIKPKF